MVNTREEAEQAVAAAKYPPEGIPEGGGHSAAAQQWRTTMFDYSRRANDEVKVRVLIEHPRAIENIDAILDVKASAARSPRRSIWPSTWATSTAPDTWTSRRRWQQSGLGEDRGARLPAPALRHDPPSQGARR